MCKQNIKSSYKYLIENGEHRMPNWVKNRIITGNKKITEELLKKYGTLSGNDCVKSLELDFNKIIPMPEDLSIEFSSKSDIALSLYLTSVSPNVDYFGEKEDKLSDVEFDDIKKRISNHLISNNNLIIKKESLFSVLDKFNSELDKLIELGQKQVNNIIKYNAANWYEWSIKNWGTKWNSRALEVDLKEASLKFETAWNPAIPIFIEITRQNPNYKFAFLYADESIGSHTGYILASNGHIDYKGKFEDYSIDAYKLSFDLWDCADLYKFDSLKNTYVYKDES